MPLKWSKKSAVESGKANTLVVRGVRVCSGTDPVQSITCFILIFIIYKVLHYISNYLIGSKNKSLEWIGKIQLEKVTWKPAWKCGEVALSETELSAKLYKTVDWGSNHKNTRSWAIIYNGTCSNMSWASISQKWSCSYNKLSHGTLVFCAQSFHLCIWQPVYSNCERWIYTMAVITMALHKRLLMWEVRVFSRTYTLFIYGRALSAKPFSFLFSYPYRSRPFSTAS